MFFCFMESCLQRAKNESRATPILTFPHFSEASHVSLAHISCLDSQSHWRADSTGQDATCLKGHTHYVTLAHTRAHTHAHARRPVQQCRMCGSEFLMLTRHTIDSSVNFTRCAASTYMRRRNLSAPATAAISAVLTSAVLCVCVDRR